MNAMVGQSLLGPLLSREAQMRFIVDTMREMSLISDPQELVGTYRERMRQVMPFDCAISISRRGLEAPQYRITRSTIWDEDVNPWKQQEQLPVLETGLLGRLIYQDQPTIIADLEVPDDDPAAVHFAGMKSLMAIPLYEEGYALNMVVILSRALDSFPIERLAVHVWMGNLFGRATHTLILSNQVKEAYEAVERELSAVADIQRSLLPAELPVIDNLEFAVHYQTSRHSGGDYYDFFKMPDDQWGILIADVSGHGTPAAVLMAITHSIAHVVCDPPVAPCRMLEAINSRLAKTYTGGSGSFVSAFYGVYDPRLRSLTWANAGHPPPRLRRADGRIEPLPLAQSLPLGIDDDERFEERTTLLSPGDVLLFYTDGLTEARDPSGAMYDEARLDQTLLKDATSAAGVVANVIDGVEKFAAGRPLADDCTVLAARVK